MKLQKLTKNQPHDKPKRSIFGGVLCHGQSFSLSQRLFGNSPNAFDSRRFGRSQNVWNREKMVAALEDRRRRQRGRLRVSTNEFSLIRGSIEDSIKEVGIYPVEIIVEYPDGSYDKYLVTKS